MSAFKINARAKVAAALKTGELVRPTACDECHQPGPTSSDGRATIHGHHHRGYEFPLDVVWLCPTCHFRKDKRPSKEMNGNAKIDCETVAAIRANYRPGRGGGRWHGASANSMQALADKFGVSKATIHRVVRNVNWIDETLNGRPV